MEIALLVLVVISGSVLTFFSGFGLGTILLPVFLIFFKPEIAIPATALVHFSNSVFKFVTVFRYIHLQTLLRFGIPAVVAALLGSYLLGFLEKMPDFYSYKLAGNEFTVTWIKFIFGFLIVLFTWVESSKRINELKISGSYLLVGGFLSGFFGGLSGHQGALRSLFLKKTLLTKEQLLGTSNAISLAIDIVRIIMYLQVISLSTLFLSASGSYILAGMIAALAGVIIGSYLLKKITINLIQKVISICLLIFGLLMMGGVV